MASLELEGPLLRILDILGVGILTNSIPTRHSLGPFFCFFLFFLEESWGNRDRLIMYHVPT